VQWDELYVRILDPNNGLLLREHVRQKRGWYRIKKEDHPKYRPLCVSQLLLHHGHVLKCGPRSWRTKIDLPAQEAAE
jgi:hypothetical protein